MYISDIDNLRKPETLEEKYKVAVNALQAISQYDADSALILKIVASKTLVRLGESTHMKNKYNKNPSH